MTFVAFVRFVVEKYFSEWIKRCKVNGCHSVSRV